MHSLLMAFPFKAMTEARVTSGPRAEVPVRFLEGLAFFLLTRK